MIPVLGIPFYNGPELLARCLASIDFPVDRLVIVDNSGLALARHVAIQHGGKCRRLHIIDHPNAGVAGAWNEIIKLFPAAWWFLVNNDIQFSPGDLRTVYEHVDQSVDFPGGKTVCAYANHGASAWAVTALGVLEVGLFDENIYPAYLEDCDWSYRADLLGMKRENIPGCRMIHGTATDPQDASKGSCTVNRTPQLAAKNARTHGANFDYYRAKWGGRNGEETCKTPFNDPQIPVWAWRFLPAHRHAQQW